MFFKILINEKPLNWSPISQKSMRTKGCMLNMEKDKRKWHRVLIFQYEWSDEQNPKLESFLYRHRHTFKNKILIHFNRFILEE